MILFLTLNLSGILLSGISKYFLACPDTINTSEGRLRIENKYSTSFDSGYYRFLQYMQSGMKTDKVI